MDTKRAAARILAVALAAQAFAAPGLRAWAPEPTTVRGGIRTFGGEAERVRLVAWAAGRFEIAGLEAPEVDVHFHQDTAGCAGHLGLELGGRVDHCVPHVSEIARDVLLHEMGHAWIDQYVATPLRERFTELRDLTEWNASGVAFEEKAYEHGAEIIAWGLGTRWFAPEIPDREPWQLRVAFELLTGVEIPADPEADGEPWTPGAPWVPTGS
jgi:hypothetical protein